MKIIYIILKEEANIIVIFIKKCIANKKLKARLILNHKKINILKSCLAIFTNVFGHVLSNEIIF